VSYFSFALKQLMDSRNPPLEQKDVCNVTGLSQGHISRLVRGLQQYVSREDYLSIANGIAQNKEEQLKLLEARCRDSLIGPGADQIKIEVKGKLLLKDESRPYRVRISPQFEAAIQHLHKMVVEYPDAEEWFIKQMKFMGMR
jgi:transcriptional regulator with XRE-family HTH domain